jgi:ankyrin repeat protein
MIFFFVESRFIFLSTHATRVSNKKKMLTSFSKSFASLAALGKTNLFKCLSKDEEYVKLVNDFREKDFGRTVLHIAVMKKRVDLVELLLNEFKIDPNVKDEYSRTALHLCTDIDSLVLLHNAGASFDEVTKSGNNIAHVWCSTSQFKKYNPLLKYLLVNVKFGKKLLTTKNREGYAPIHIALLNNNFDAVKWMLASSASLLANLPFFLYNGFNAYLARPIVFLAMSFRMVNLLTSYGTRILDRDENGDIFITHQLLTKGYSCIPFAINLIKANPFLAQIKNKNGTSILTAMILTGAELWRYIRLLHHFTPTVHDLEAAIIKDASNVIEIILNRKEVSITPKLFSQSRNYLTASMLWSHLAVEDRKEAVELLFKKTTISEQTITAFISDIEGDDRVMLDVLMAQVARKDTFAFILKKAFPNPDACRFSKFDFFVDLLKKVLARASSSLTAPLEFLLENGYITSDHLNHPSIVDELFKSQNQRMCTLFLENGMVIDEKAFSSKIRTSGFKRPFIKNRVIEALSSSSSSSSSSKECPICLELRRDDEFVSLFCESPHEFCAHCIPNFTNLKCPFCRESF